MLDAVAGHIAAAAAKTGKLRHGNCTVPGKLGTGFQIIKVGDCSRQILYHHFHAGLADTIGQHCRPGVGKIRL